MSTSEDKYITMRKIASEGISMCRLLNELLLESVLKEMKRHDDNKTSLTVTQDPESQNCIKHIDVIYYHIQELVKNVELAIEWIFSLNILTNGLTKALLIGSFKRH